jgi:hypothetical protein
MLNPVTSFAHRADRAARSLAVRSRRDECLPRVQVLAAQSGDALSVRIFVAKTAENSYLDVLRRRLLQRDVGEQLGVAFVAPGVRPLVFLGCTIRVPTL